MEKVETKSAADSFTKKLFRLLKRIYQILFIKKYRKCFIQYNRACVKSLRGNYAEAIKIYHDLLTKKDLISESLICKNLGVVYFWSNKFDESETYLRKSLELCVKEKKNDSELYEYLGRVSLKKLELEEALLFFERAARFGRKGCVNRMSTDLEHVEETKDILESHKEDLPFLTAYYKQNKNRFE